MASEDSVVVGRLIPISNQIDAMVTSSVPPPLVLNDETLRKLEPMHKGLLDDISRLQGENKWLRTKLLEVMKKRTAAEASLSAHRDRIAELEKENTALLDCIPDHVTAIGPVTEDLLKKIVSPPPSCRMYLSNETGVAMAKELLEARASLSALLPRDASKDVG